MYCPQCGAQLAAQAERCHRCDLDMRPVLRLLRAAAGRDQGLADYLAASGREQEWAQQRQSWGKLLILCSLLVGCFLPIVIGLFSGYSGLGSMILVLSGLIGVLLMLGCIMLLAADREILVAPRSPTAPALSDQQAGRATAYEEPASQRVPH